MSCAYAYASDYGMRIPLVEGVRMCDFVGSFAGEESLCSRVQLLDAAYALCLLLGKEIRAYGVRSGDAARDGVEEMMWRGGQPRDADVRLWMDGWEVRVCSVGVWMWASGG
jgi:hypothetical protein